MTLPRYGQVIVNLDPVPIGNLNIAGQAIGDLIYFNGAAWARFPVGNNGDLLQVVGGIPAWAHVLQNEINGLTIGVSAGAPEPDNDKVHIWDGTAGAVVATAGTILTLESNSVDGYLSILGPTSAGKGIVFGEPGTPLRGLILYHGSADAPADTFSFWTATNERLRYSAGVFSFQEPTTVGTTFGDLILDPTGNIDANLNSMVQIGNAGSQLLPDAWTMVSANTQVLLVETTGAATVASVTAKIPASSTGSARVQFTQGAGNGAANNMGLYFWYDGNSSLFALRSLDIDGSSTDGNVMELADGTNDMKFFGGISTDGEVVPTSGITVGNTGTVTGIIRFYGTTSGVVGLTVAAAAGTWTMTLPAATGAGAGQQLTDTAGNGITAWAAAASQRELKSIIDLAKPQDALDLILNTRVYRFNYKEGMGTLDTVTEYVGLMADESPWAMHYGNSIVNPVNTLGFMVLGLQATNERIDKLERQLVAAGITPEV